MGQFFRLQDLRAIAPELELVIWGMILLIADLVIHDKKKIGILAIVGILFSGAFVFMANGVSMYAYGGSIAVDQFANFFKLIFLVGAALSILLSLRYLDIERENHGEYYALMLFATMGM